MNPTKITTANVRIMLSFNYSNFEIQMNLENENGIEIADIDKARSQCQTLATDAVNEYKRLGNTNPKVELARVENKLADIKALIKETDKTEPEKIDPTEMAKVEAMPLYTDIKQKQPTFAGERVANKDKKGTK